MFTRRSHEQTGTSRFADPDVAVVLVHGFACTAPVLYWCGLRPLRQRLTARGANVFVSRQPGAAGVVERARHLSSFLANLPHRRLVLVGHSMGGLDARWVASRMDPTRRISHVVTLGTPHRGTVAAEWALRHPSWQAYVARSLDQGALRDLTREGVERLAEKMPNRDDVVYRSLAGKVEPKLFRGSLRRLSEVVMADEGENDGVVATSSALHGSHGSLVRTDHFALIGMPIAFTRGHSLPACGRRALSKLAVVLRSALAGERSSCPNGALAASLS